MTPEQTADLNDLSLDLLAEANDDGLPDSLRIRAHRHREALTALRVAKPSESSMVQRIEALEKALRQERTDLITWMRGGPLDAARMVSRIDAALDGPPDPERDREQPGEAERP